MGNVKQNLRSLQRQLKCFEAQKLTPKSRWWKTPAEEIHVPVNLPGDHRRRFIIFKLAKQKS